MSGIYEIISIFVEVEEKLEIRGPLFNNINFLIVK